MTKDIAKADKAMTTGLDIDPRTYRRIWRGMLSKNVRELSDETGLSVDEVVRIRNGMLEAPDALTVEQQLSRLVSELFDVAERARDAYDRVRDERALAPILTAQTGAIKTAMQQLREAQKENRGDVERLNSVRQRELLLVVRSAGDRFLDWVATQGIDRDEAQSMYHGFLTDAARDLEERNE